MDVQQGRFAASTGSNYGKTVRLRLYPGLAPQGLHFNFARVVHFD